MDDQQLEFESIRRNVAEIIRNEYLLIPVDKTSEIEELNPVKWLEENTILSTIQLQRKNDPIVEVAIADTLPALQGPFELVQYGKICRHLMIRSGFPLEIALKYPSTYDWIRVAIYFKQKLLEIQASPFAVQLSHLKPWEKYVKALSMGVVDNA